MEHDFLLNILGRGIVARLNAKLQGPRLNLEKIEKDICKATADSLARAPLVSQSYAINPSERGHMDNIARFVDRNTIIAAEVTEAEAAASPLCAENRRRLEENFRILSAARDIHDKPFKIIRMPAADLHIETMKPGDPVYDFMADLSYRPAHAFPKGRPINVAHAASYLNFLLTNGLVLTSKLYVPGAPLALKRKDAETVRILKKVFTHRRVIAIESRSVNLGGGRIHCITANEPK